MDPTPARHTSSLTHKITALAATWLDESGFKPVETEVAVAPGWVAAIVGACRPTPTAAVRLKLLPPRPPGGSEFVQATWRTNYHSIPRIITGIVEVRIIRPDYFAAARNGFTPRSPI